VDPPLIALVAVVWRDTGERGRGSILGKAEGGSMEELRSIMMGV
jgi:hypothetical protein